MPPVLPDRTQLNPILTRAEHKRLMYGALLWWVATSLLVIFQPYLLEIPPVRVVVTLLLALPIAIFWFIFWPQRLIAQIAPSPHIQTSLLLSGPIVMFLLFWGLIHAPLMGHSSSSGKVFMVRPAHGENYAIHHYSNAELTRDTGSKSGVDAFFIPYSESVRNGHLRAIYVVFAPGESAFVARYRPSNEHRAVQVRFDRRRDFVEIPKAGFEEPQ